MLTIEYTNSGTDALVRLVSRLDVRHGISLPSDMCESVLIALKIKGLKFSFYSVERKWLPGADAYIFEKKNKDLVFVVSDLFNFGSIDLCAFANKRIILDLAHCSFAMAEVYLKQIRISAENIELIGIIFSFGPGKFQRFGGGGCLIGLDVKHDDILVSETLIETFTSERFTYKPLDLVRNLFYQDEIYDCETATRMVLRPRDFSDSCDIITKLRNTEHIDISDGLYDNITGTRRSEFYFWKSVWKCHN
jgi:hypothetical protein